MGEAFDLIEEQLQYAINPETNTEPPPLDISRVENAVANTDFESKRVN